MKDLAKQLKSQDKPKRKFVHVTSARPPEEHKTIVPVEIRKQVREDYQRLLDKQREIAQLALSLEEKRDEERELSLPSIAKRHGLGATTVRYILGLRNSKRIREY